MNKMMQLFVMLSLGLSINAHAQSAVLMYIQPFEYINEIKLQHYTTEHWFAQGPVVEPIAKEHLTKVLGEVSICEGKQTGKILVWVQPRMFYNGQLQVFYGQVTANVYTGVGQLVASYVGESTQQGSLNIQPDYWLNLAYTHAVEKMQEKMQADTHLQTILTQPSELSGSDTPCSMVTLLPVPRVRAMSF
ncbi:MAG: hypothetical protein HOP21_05665 [Methylotenera sp.]|nr:hypothetical protein [Methylotenera sp.]